MLFVTRALTKLFTSLGHSDDPVCRGALAVVCASLRERISALAYRPEPHPLSHQALSALSLNQFLVSDAPTGNCRNEAVEPRERMILDVAFVQAESKFIDVAAKMFRAGVMIDADQTALEHRENTLDAVRGHSGPDKLAFAMIDRIMSEEDTIKAVVASGFLSMDGRADFDPFMDFGLNCIDVCVGDMRQGRAAPIPTLAHSKNRSLT